jgi:hypothetical protein
MAVNPVAELLARQSRSKLKAMLEGIEATEASLKAQRQLVEEALGEKAGKSANSAVSEQGASGRGHTGTSEVLRGIMRESNGRVLMPKEIIGKARERGVTSSDAAIRVALRRIHQVEGLIERGPGGTGWRLASSNGSAPESFSEAPSSASGEHGRQSSHSGSPGVGASSPDSDVQTRIEQNTS